MSNKHHWGMTLTAEQRATVQKIKRANGHTRDKEATDGWTVYMMPSTGPAKYLELRHHLSGGGMARWVIERDGTVSATNRKGQRRDLVAA